MRIALRHCAAKKRRWKASLAGIRARIEEVRREAERLRGEAKKSR